MPSEQRFTFDEVGELYDRHRPGYPESLFDDLIAQSGLSVGDRVLEIGAGTGQATLPLAKRGFSIVCLEPGSSLVEIARRNLADYPKVRTECVTFEDWDTEDPAFDLVFSAQAFHWLSPDTRFSRCKAALRPGGTLAVFGNAVVPIETPARDGLNAVYSRLAPSVPGPMVTRWYAQEGPVIELFEESGCFGVVSASQYPWRQHYPTADYLELLRTHSDHQLLPPEQRRALLDAVAEVLEENGGGIEVQYEANLYAAKRLPYVTPL